MQPIVAEYAILYMDMLLKKSWKGSFLTKRLPRGGLLRALAGDLFEYPEKVT